jgi:hypothetical protein
VNARGAIAIVTLFLMAAVAGCCDTSRYTSALPLGPEGEACATTCLHALTDSGDDFVSCAFGFDDGARAVLCTYEHTFCPDAM